MTVFPGEIYRGLSELGGALQTSATRAKSTGGHLAAWEEPELLVEEVRAAFRSLR